MYTSNRQQKIAYRQSTAQKSNSTQFTTQSAFRDAERNFKSRLPEPDFSRVIDFDRLNQDDERYNNYDQEKNEKEIIKFELRCDLGECAGFAFDEIRKNDGERESCETFPNYDEGLKNQIRKNRKTGFMIKDVPGFIFIRNPFTPQAQRRLIKRCMKDFAKFPNLNNLETHYALPKDGLWNLHQRIISGELPEDDQKCFIPLKATITKSKAKFDDHPVDISGEKEKNTADLSEVLVDIPKKQSSELTFKTSNEFTTQENSFTPNLLSKSKPDPPPSVNVPLLRPSQLLRKLRWTTLGYQYHWPTKTYHFDRRHPFPTDIGDLTTAVVKAINGIRLPDISYVNQYPIEKWRPEAGVVNYYQLRDNLMAHVDRSEINTRAPLVSISFGHACIFLMGGPTRDHPPKAIYLRSGDILVMCPPSRGYFHGVPRILEGTLPPYLSPNYSFIDDTSKNYPKIEEKGWCIFGEYMKTTRININVRQVFDGDCK
ncbi:hypothetical protein G9A89_018994 [Geosiphon pyriformis]|nr:hypothetical protein G9A89_018994 [Geosiphon pyriformis]